MDDWLDDATAARDVLDVLAAAACELDFATDLDISGGVALADTADMDEDADEDCNEDAELVAMPWETDSDELCEMEAVCCVSDEGCDGAQPANVTISEAATNCRARANLSQYRVAAMCKSPQRPFVK